MYKFHHLSDLLSFEHIFMSDVCAHSCVSSHRAATSRLTEGILSGPYSLCPCFLLLQTMLISQLNICALNFFHYNSFLGVEC